METATPRIEQDRVSGIRPTLAELVALRAVAGGGSIARRASSGVRAQAPAAARGHGMEYAESRDYVAGDDARHIDWRVTARTGRTHTKTFQAERERLTLLVADTTPPLYIGTRVRFKSVQAARAGAIATWAAIADGDRVAAMRGTAQEAPVPPASGRRGALRVLHALARWYAEPPPDDDGLGIALEHAARVARPGSRVCVLADAGSVVTVPARRWLALSAHSEVLVLLLSDPLEQAPPRARLRFSGPSGPVALDLAQAALRAQWDDAFGGTLARATGLLQAARVRSTVLSSEMPSGVWLPMFSRPRVM